MIGDPFWRARFSSDPAAITPVTALRPTSDHETSDYGLTSMTDLKHAFRMLIKRPAFTLVAVITLAVGIGANTAIFSVVNGVLLRPLPYPEADRIVRLWEQTSRAARVTVSYPNFRDWHERLTRFEGLAAYEGGTTTVLGGSEPAFADVYAVTRDFFKVLGVAPALGRTFTESESTDGGPAVVVVGYRFWHQSLQSNTDLSALRVSIEGVGARVVGVMPPGFAFPARADIWAPKELFPDNTGRTAHNLDVIGRLGATFERASAELPLVAAQLQTEHAGDEDAQAITMVPLQAALTGGSRTMLLLLLGAVGLVLLIACANVASTMSARGEERRVELAIRAALGARRSRLVRQLLVESLLLGGAGALGGLLLGAWLVRWFLAMNAASLLRQEAIGMDGRVLLFTLGLALLTPLLFGILPALYASKPNVRDTIAEAGRGALSTVRRGIRDVLVALEVALALVLLVGSLLLIFSFWNVLSVDAGFELHGIITMEMSVPAEKYPDADRSAAFYTRLLDRIRAVPGVEAAGAINSFPLSGNGFGGGFAFEGDTDRQQTARSAGYRVVTPGYFAAMRISPVKGRLLSEADRAGSEVVAVVNQEFVRRYIPAGDALGRRFRYYGMDSRNEPDMTIVGVIGDIRDTSLVRGPAPEVYVSYQQRPRRTRGTMTVAVRPAQIGMTGSLTPRLRAAVSSVDPDVPIKLSTMEERVEESVADRRFTMTMLTAFAAIAVLLAAVGIYSVLSQSVVQRTAEIGIRMALGAGERSVVALILGTAMRSVLAGIVIGGIGAAGAVRLLQAFLFGVKAVDPVAFGVAAMLLVCVALIASYLPAHRAARLDPLQALRVA